MDIVALMMLPKHQQEMGEDLAMVEAPTWVMEEEEVVATMVVELIQDHLLATILREEEAVRPI